MSTAAFDRGRVLVVGGGAAAIVGGAVIAVATGLVAPVVLAVIVLVTVAIARETSWRVSLGLSLLGAMVTQVCFLRITPHLGVDLRWSDLALWVVIGVAAAIVVALRGVPVMTRSQAESLVSVMVVPVVGVVAYVVTYLASGSTWVGWAMNNDVAYKSLMVRWSLDDHGLIAARGYSDPLTSSLLASWSAEGAAGGSLGQVMRVIVHSDAQIWILLWLLVSCVCSVIALRNARESRGYRLGLAIAAGLLPWTWFLAGSAFELGFQNVAPSILVVLLAWLLWTQRSDHPVAVLAGLLLATLAAATSWAPLAVIPLFWALDTLLAQRRAVLTAPLRARLVPAAALALGVVYAAAVTLPETMDAGTGGLAGDGAIQQLSWRWVLGLTLTALVASVLFRRRLGSTYTWGLWWTCAAAVLVDAFLLYERRDMPALWGYYPIKFTWLVVASALLIGFGESASGLRRLTGRMWGGNGLVLGGAMVVGAMHVMTPFWAPGSPFTPLRLAHTHDHDVAAASMFDILDTHPKSFVSAYSPDRWTGPTEDGFINFWLFQMTARTTDDPIRRLAYHFDPTDAPNACAAVSVWGPDVQVWTRNRSTAKAFRQSCSPDFVAVRFHGRLGFGNG